MFSRVLIEEAGDSQFITGDVVSKLTVDEANQQLAEKSKKNQAKYTQLLLGITKASLSTDSFLSAASFQDTTRVLIAAATSGKVDHLYGLKENVILGRRIPVGTGAISEEDQQELDELERQPETVASKV
jgi:DNA-directed RNA polymerase subunit beta'